jgi:hypothetical protein
MKTLSHFLLALALLTLPLVTACWCEGGASWHAYAMDVAAATLDAGTPVLVPLTVGTSLRPTTDSLGVEVSITDCSAGGFDVGARLLRADGSVIDARDGFRAGSGTTVALRCPTRSVVWALPPSELECGDTRCTASFQVELTSATGAGPREVNMHLVTNDCGPTMRTDGVIDAWGE